MFLQRVLSVLLVGVLATASSADDEPFVLFVRAPWQCTPGQCKLNLTVTQVKEGFWFSLDAEDTEYVAVALAESAMMGKDNVIECQRSMNPNQSIEVYHSMNNGPPQMKLRKNERYKDQKIDAIAKNITGGMSDGRIFCSFILNPTTRFPESTVDLMKSKYFVQIAAGANLLANRTGLAKHDKWAVTLRAVSFVKDEGKLRTVDNVPKAATPGAGNSSSSNFVSNLTISGLVLIGTLISKSWL